MGPDPWRKSTIVKIIAAIDTVVAIFSVFYTGKTLLTLFRGPHVIGEDAGWILMLIVFFFTFGFQFLQVLLDLLLFKSSRENRTSLLKALRTTSFWCVCSAIFLILLIVELYVGLTRFDPNTSINLFIIFSVLKILWRVFAIYFVFMFRQDLMERARQSSLPAMGGSTTTVEFLKVIPPEVVITPCDSLGNLSEVGLDTAHVSSTKNVPK